MCGHSFSLSQNVLVVVAAGHPCMVKPIGVLAFLAQLRGLPQVDFVGTIVRFCVLA